MYSWNEKFIRVVWNNGTFKKNYFHLVENFDFFVKIIKNWFLVEIGFLVKIWLFVQIGFLVKILTFGENHISSEKSDF